MPGEISSPIKRGQVKHLDCQSSIILDEESRSTYRSREEASLSGTKNGTNGNEASEITHEAQAHGDNALDSSK